MKAPILILLILTTFGLQAQEKLYVHFSFNSSIPINKNFINQINNKQIDSILVTGYTDQVGNERYNLKLAAKRVASVIKLIPNNTKVKKIAFGKHNNLTLSDSVMRQVEIVVFRSFKQNNFATVEKVSLQEFLNTNLSNLQFLENKYVLVPGQEYTLDAAVEIINKSKFNSIKILGHSNVAIEAIDTGFVKRKIDLSLARARFVYLYFIENGIPKEKLSYYGLKDTQKLVPSNSPNAELNMRVSFKVE